MSVTIHAVEPGSVCEKKGILPGDELLLINGHEIDDFLDYRFYMTETKLRLTFKQNGVYKVITVFKDEAQDIGLQFDNYLMSRQQSCRNKCIFCFIDQLPKGLRSSLYFKDDDSRLSFLFGNYITLTNLSEHDVQRIIDMHISPVNISVHTTNPELRVKMMKNPNAAKSLALIGRFAEAGIKINTQLVLCPGINDGAELQKTMEDLASYYPNVQMIAAVPLGVTKFRENLPQLQTYTKESAAAVLDLIEAFGDAFKKQHGVRFAFAADEFYIKAERPIPDASYYEDFEQLENGVGMCALLKQEFLDALQAESARTLNTSKTIACGTAVYPLIQELADAAQAKFTGLNLYVVPVVNNFFGTTITVTGLLTGTDLIEQLKNKQLGDALILSCSMLRNEMDLFLDDTTPQQLANALHVPVIFTENNGADLLNAILTGEGKQVCQNRS